MQSHTPMYIFQLYLELEICNLWAQVLLQAKESYLFEWLAVHSIYYKLEP